MRTTHVSIPELAELHLPAEEVDIVAHNSVIVTVAPGTRIARQGDFAREVFIVLTGTVAVTRDGSPVTLVGPLEPLGEMAAVGVADHRVANADTVDTCQLLVFSRREWDTVMSRCPHLAEWATRIANSRR